MESTTNDAVATGASLIAIGLVAIIALALYIFACYCLKRICEKCGKEPGILIWIPIVQFIPLMQIADLSPWLILPLFIPVVNLIILTIMWVRVCLARNKSPWLVIMMFIPVVNIAFVPYLAFSE